MSVTVHGPPTRPLLGLRRQPGRLALAFMRLPRPLYHHGWGRFLGHTFMLIVHQGRKSGKRRETVAMALTYDAATREWWIARLHTPLLTAMFANFATFVMERNRKDLSPQRRRDPDP